MPRKQAKVYFCSCICGARARRNLLGRDQIWELDLLAIVNAISSDSLKQFPKLFTGLGKMPEVFKITLAKGTQPYRLFSPRPIPSGLREKAKKEIDSMLALGVIEPVEESTECCSGPTIPPKLMVVSGCASISSVLTKGSSGRYTPYPG